MDGGCLCGQVRYSISGELLAAVTCHCINCQKQSGSALSLVAVIARDAISLTGTLKTYEDRGTSGDPVWRKFCPECGSPVLTDTPAARAQDIIFVKAGTIDDSAEHVRPDLHYWTERRHPWLGLPDGDRCLRFQEMP